jgi:hypothetical protein
MLPSLPHTPPSISTLSKISLIELPPLTSEEQPLEKSTKTVLSDMLPQSDYLTIYNGLTVLFIGDHSIRTLYRGVAKVLKYNRSLECSEASRQNGKYNCIEGSLREKMLDKLLIITNTLGETNLRHKGTICTVEYQDIKQFVLPNNSTKLIYLHLGSLLNDKSATDALKSLKDIRDLKTIDVVIFCSYTSDMHE